MSRPTFYGVMCIALFLVLKFLKGHNMLGFCLIFFGEARIQDLLLGQGAWMPLELQAHWYYFLDRFFFANQIV
jgi:hypothetical protein